MGPFDYFRRRRERESAVAGLSASADPSQPVSATAAGGEVAPQAEVEAEVQAGGGLDLAQLAQLGTLIAQAAREGKIQVHQGSPQEIDLRGTGLREEILGIMQQHGVDLPGADHAGNMEIEIEHPGPDDQA